VLDHQDELGVEVVVVAFAIPTWLALYERELGRPGVRFLSDTDRVAYRAFDFPRGIDAPRVARPARLATLRGAHRARPAAPGPPREDPLQLGGDVLVDARGSCAGPTAARARGPPVAGPRSGVP
jgi:hypothetical protein